MSMPFFGTELSVRQVGATPLTETLVRTTIATHWKFPDVQFVGPGLLRAIDGARQLDVDLGLGTLWYRDATYLWNPDAVAMSLPSDTECGKLARAELDAIGLSVPDTKTVKTHIEWVASSKAVRDTGGKRRETQVLDKHVSLAFWLGGSEVVPIRAVGFGAKAGVTLHDRGYVIGLHYSWRPIGDVVVTGEILTPRVSETELDPVLVYVQGWYMDQRVVYPAWARRSASRIAGRQAVARTTFEPAISPPEKLTRWIPEPTPRTQIARLMPLEASKAGTVWRSVGADSYTKTNVERFQASMLAGGWKSAFDQPGPRSKMSDWSAAKKLVDRADLVFYAGHAAPFGWEVGDQDWFEADRGKRPEGRFGADQLEWLAIAGCGPLQDDVIPGSGGGNAFDWSAIFGGLHVLMGYASQVADLAEEGQFLATHGLSGTPVIDSWFCTARDVQSRATVMNGKPESLPVWVAALYAEGRGLSSRRDRFTDSSETIADPTGIRDFVCIWTPA